MVVAHSAPFSLVRHVAAACEGAGVRLGGENALFTLRPADLATVLDHAPRRLSSLTYLRLCDALLRGYRAPVAGGGGGGGGGDALQAAGVGWWDRQLLRRARVSRRSTSVRVLAWASPWARFVALAHALRDGVPFWREPGDVDAHAGTGTG